MSLMIGVFFFFKQKTAYEMRISDWSSDVCSSDLIAIGGQQIADPVALEDAAEIPAMAVIVGELGVLVAVVDVIDVAQKFDVGPKPARSRALGIAFEHLKIGSAHVSTPVTNAHLVCRLLLENKTKLTHTQR